MECSIFIIIQNSGGSALLKKTIETITEMVQTIITSLQTIIR